jgi:hypothetical protein
MQERRKDRLMLSHRLARPVVVGAVVIVIAGGAYGILRATSSGDSAVAGTPATTTSGTSAATTSGLTLPAKGASNARSAPSAGGAVGTVGSASKSSFTLTTSAGENVTIKETSSTKYHKGTSSIRASAIAKGTSVLVLGTSNGTTITATQVIEQTAGGKAPSSAATVVPFKRGAPTTSKKVGQIPADYSEGVGTIVAGTAANKATEAALIAYPGGVVDRVVRLSAGAYEVHNIGVNWPHHIFVSKQFKVIGAE